MSVCRGSPLPASLVGFPFHSFRYCSRKVKESRGICKLPQAELYIHSPLTPFLLCASSGITERKGCYALFIGQGAVQQLFFYCFTSEADNQPCYNTRDQSVYIFGILTVLFFVSFAVRASAIA